MLKIKNRKSLLTLGFVLGAGYSTPIVAFASPEVQDNEVSEVDNEVENVHKSKIYQFLEEKRKEKAKKIIDDIPESSPLTLESKEEIVNYYTEKYMPKEGCSLIELPVDSDLDYVPPQPKEEPEPQEQSDQKEKSGKNEQIQPQNTKSTISASSSQVQANYQPQLYQGNPISMTDEERYWLEKLVQAEAGGESYEGKLAVATVIANRVESSLFPNTVNDVITANNGKFHQFQPWDDGRIYDMVPDNETKKAVAEVFDHGVRNLPEETTYFAVKSIAFDNWMGKTRQYITTIGNHAFFSQHAK